jgi:hypothetical protein
VAYIASKCQILGGATQIKCLDGLENQSSCTVRKTDRTRRLF